MTLGSPHRAVLGIAGWSGAGKTTLIEGVMPHLRTAGLSVSTIKHTHHGVDLDRPGKDSWRHREAGAQEVLIAGAGRWALLHEEPGLEPDLAALLPRLSPVDLVLVEGFRRYGVPKLEVFRPALGKPPLWPDWPDVAAIASDASVPGCDRPVLDLSRLGEIATWIMSFVQSTIAKP
ncbi:molybdopterin-guanine dinucleotide biosynthesis protein B [Acidisphaera sp. L21]|uniref:molybdopterin-guanine dinucleotide biosynthesis protein B n=1 Tax=Acidisphaera sp. L21 TaxID=1641851 RepID=UPI00131D87BA|nr:molybdopterin-guanine dinucleotide biosynthesis protein B [Acidisphaera sp. L21]